MKNNFDKIDESLEIKATITAKEIIKQPRAYEVFGQLIKSVADSTDKLMDIHQKVKELKKEEKSGPKNVTNALFIGSTAELQKLLKNGLNAEDISK